MNIKVKYGDSADTFSAEAPLVRDFPAKRGAGYCMNESCEIYLKPSFVMHSEGQFLCHKCKEKGKIKIESFSVKNHEPVYKEVRVEFNYDPLTEQFKSLVIVRDEEIIDSANIFTLYTPSLAINKRALKVAEQLLNNLLLVEDPGSVRFNFEDIVYTDEPIEMFKARLEMISNRWLQVKEKLERYKK